MLHWRRLGCRRLRILHPVLNVVSHDVDLALLDVAIFLQGMVVQQLRMVDCRRKYLEAVLKPDQRGISSDGMLAAQVVLRRAIDLNE